MCLIVFAWRPGHAQPLIVAANRDEFYARPSLPLAQWADAPQVYAGRDQEAGGTWLGVNADGRFAALTNIRDPHQPPARKSRGELVARQPLERTEAGHPGADGRLRVHEVDRRLNIRVVARHIDRPGPARRRDQEHDHPD